MPSPTESTSRRTPIGRRARGSSSASTANAGAESTGSKAPSPSVPSKTSSPQSPADPRLVELVQSWTSSLPKFCQEALTIRTKNGSLLPFNLNRSQLHLHSLLQDQKKRTGMVRAVILKGRQQGISTYLQARFYWMTSLRRGRRAVILTHRIDASENLFGMAERFHQYAPLKPHVGTCNAKELVFDRLDSSYQVATAGSSGTGRSGTAQLFHGSEVAFWPFAADHLSGVAQVVAREPGTEIVYESTANGMANAFYDLWQSASSGRGDFIAVFLPWFWEPGYRAAVPDGFRLDDAEAEYQRVHDLTLEQMVWRRLKIVDDFGGDPTRFAQEYPATPSEAFTASDHDPLIRPDVVMGAIARKISTPTQRLVVGVDPARFGNNSTAIARRRGRQLVNVERLPRQDTMATVGRIVTLIRDERPVRIFMDLGGLGAGIYDRLVELGYGSIVTPINFGDDANRPDRFVNRRAEMWASMRDWLATGGSIPKDDSLIRDLSGPKFSWDSDGRLKLEPKEKMRERGVPSPDSGDALGLTFAIPIETLESGNPMSSAWDDMMQAFQDATDNNPNGMLGVHTG